MSKDKRLPRRKTIAKNVCFCKVDMEFFILLYLKGVFSSIMRVGFYKSAFSLRNTRYTPSCPHAILKRRYWLKNADNSRVILSAMSARVFLDGDIAFLSQKWMSLCYVEICVPGLKTQVEYSCPNGTFAFRWSILVQNYFWVLPGDCRLLRLAMARKKRIFCRKIDVRSFGFCRKRIW